MRAAAQGQAQAPIDGKKFNQNSAKCTSDQSAYLDSDSQSIRPHVCFGHATRQINAQEEVADHAALDSLPVVSAEEQDTLSACSTFSLMRSGAAGEADDSIAEDYMTS
eukprot:15593-Heterococcus_DN1.PRE.2